MNLKASVNMTGGTWYPAKMTCGGVSLTNNQYRVRLPDSEEPVDPNTGEYDDFWTQWWTTLTPPGQASMNWSDYVACWDENGEVEYC